MLLKEKELSFARLRHRLAVLDEIGHIHYPDRGLMPHLLGEQRRPGRENKAVSHKS